MLPGPFSEFGVKVQEETDAGKSGESGGRAGPLG